MSSKWRQKMSWKSNLVFLKIFLWSVLVFKYLHCAERWTVCIFPSQHNIIWVVHTIQNVRCHCLINCFWTVVLEKTLESPLDCKEIQPVHPKGNQSWIFIGRTDAEAETPILWPPYAKNWLIGKDPYTGKDWRQEEKGMTQDEMAGWHHWLNGHEFV